MWTVAGFNLRMLDVRMMRTTTERLSGIGLTPAAATVLLALESNPGLPLGLLADALIVQHPNMTKLVKRLEAQKLVRRNAAPGDRRRISLVLTPAGRRLALQALDVLNEHDAQALSVLKPAERRQFLHLVGRVLAGFEAAERKTK
jgi:DNA-binding MarR family transcriptional regulator